MGPREKRNSEFECSQVLQAVRNADERRRRFVLDKVVFHADLFGRLQQYENQQRDAEAERLIASYVARQPASPYLLVQTALVQEEALKQARQRIADLESRANQASGQGSFLGNAPRPAGP